MKYFFLYFSLGSTALDVSEKSDRLPIEIVLKQTPAGKTCFCFEFVS